MISMIAAIGQNREIGKDNDLIWHLPDDMRFFKDTTKNKVVIMGRKNFESLPPKWKPLPNRINLIISRNPDYDAMGCEVFTSLEESLERAQKLTQDEIFIIGGGQIYELGLPYANKMYLTEIHESFDADAFFPAWDESIWKEISRVPHPTDEKHKHPFDFVTYTKL